MGFASLLVFGRKEGLDYVENSLRSSYMITEREKIKGSEEMRSRDLGGMCSLDQIKNK